MRRTLPHACLLGLAALLLAPLQGGGVSASASGPEMFPVPVSAERAMRPVAPPRAVTATAGANQARAKSQHTPGGAAIAVAAWQLELGAVAIETSAIQGDDVRPAEVHFSFFATGPPQLT